MRRKWNLLISTLVVALCTGIVKFSNGVQQFEQGSSVEDAWDQHFSKQYEQVPIQAMGFIQRADLDVLFERPLVTLQYNDTSILNKTFFESISRFTVPYDWTVNTKDDDKLMMLRTLTKVTEYNLRRPVEGGTVIEMMISISPKGNIVDDLNEAFDIINKTNSKFPGTVSALLLHYGTLRLNSEATNLVRQDIASCNQYKTSSSGSFNVTCGVILDSRNCAGYIDNLNSLLISNNNLIFFDTRETSFKTYVIKVVSMVPCLLNLFQKTTVGFRYPDKVTVDLDTGQYYRTPELYQRISEMVKYYVQDIEIHYQNYSQNRSQDQITSSQLDILSEEWLRRPLDLHKLHIGVTIHSSQVTNPELMIPLTFGTFRTVVIETAGGSSKGDLRRQYNLVREVASSAKKMDAMKKSNKEPNVFDYGIPVQIMISVTISHDSPEANKRTLDGAFSAIKAANNIYPGIVKAVVFEWNLCLKSEPCEPIKEIEPLKYYVSRHFRLLESAFLYAIKLRNSTGMEYTLKLGIAFDKQLIYDYSFYFQGSDAFAHAPLFSKADLFVYKVTVEGQQLFELGALKLSQTFIPTLHPLRTIMESVLRVVRAPIPESAMFQIKISGCGEGSVRNGIYDEAQYARFWQIVNNWAVLENATVVIDTAFEEETASSTKCRFDRSPFKGRKGCACGWWRVTRSNGSGSNIQSPNVILRDKKTIALQRHIQANLPQNHIPVSRKFSSWDVSIFLVPAVLITILVGAFAAYLGRHHRRRMKSYIILTRQDLKTFFRGNVDQLNRFEQNLQFGTKGHPDSQPYPKEKYELSPTLFKVSTRCLGLGEFGVVFCGSILRGGREKEVAVKLINKQANSSGDHSHGRYLALKGLISEIKLLSYVGEHTHIVKLEGAYTAKLKKGKVMVFLEYCELGSLEKYLQSCAPNLDGMTEVLPAELSNDLYRWAGEIACGMAFLASKNVVHADLAARNVLLTSQKCAKISDFGLSRRLYDYTEYLKTEQGPLPWRWMSPESLRKMVFNEKSDVWSFGVTLWEMYTLGDIPYPGLSWEVNFHVSLEAGVRLAEPRWNERKMYSIMRQCWNTIAVDRPTFSELYSMITEEILKESF